MSVGEKVKRAKKDNKFALAEGNARGESNKDGQINKISLW